MGNTHRQVDFCHDGTSNYRRKQNRITIINAEIKGGKTLYRVIFGTMEPRFMEENRTEYFKR